MRWANRYGEDSMHAVSDIRYPEQAEIDMTMAPDTEFQVFIDLHESMRTPNATGFILNYGNRFRIGIREGSLVFQFWFDSDIRHTYTVPVERAPRSFHVSMVVSRTGSYPSYSFTFFLYLNGQLRSSRTMSKQYGGSSRFASGMEIGKAGYLYQYGGDIPGTFRGIVSEVRLYKRKLSDNDRYKHMSFTLPQLDSSLAHYWPLCGDYIDRVTNNELHVTGNPFFWQTPTEHLKLFTTSTATSANNRLRRSGGDTYYLIERRFFFEFLIKSEPASANLSTWHTVLKTEYFRIDVRNRRDLQLVINNGTGTPSVTTYTNALRYNGLDRVSLGRVGFNGQSNYSLYVSGYQVDSFTLSTDEGRFLYFSELEVGSAAAGTTISDVRIIDYNIPAVVLGQLAFARIEPTSSLVIRSWPLDLPYVHYSLTGTQPTYFPEIKLNDSSGVLETWQPVSSLQDVTAADIVDPSLSSGMLRTYDDQGRLTFDASENTAFFLDTKTVTSGQTFLYPGVDTMIGCQMVYNGPISASDWSGFLDMFKQPLGYTTSYVPDQATVNFVAPYGSADQYITTIFSWGEYP